MSNEATLKCPHCSKTIDINEAILTQLESKFNKDTQEQREKYKIAVTDLKTKEESLKQQEEQFNSKLHDALQLQLKAKEVILRESITKNITESQSQAQALLQDELNNKSKQLQEFNRTKVELESIKREKDELATSIRTELESELNKKLESEQFKQSEHIQKITTELKDEKAKQQKLRDDITKEVTETQSKAQALLKQELDNKSKELQEFNKTKVELESIKREKEEQASKIKAEEELKASKNLQDALTKANQESQLQHQKLKQEFDKNLSQRLEAEKLQMERTIKESLTVENKKEIQKMQEQINAKSEQLKELDSSKIEIAKLNMEKDEIEAKTKADVEITFYNKLSQEKQKAIQEANSQSELKLKEADVKMRQLQEQLQIAQRKAEQGSMQIQGEVQELAIEEYLAIKFPLDTIEEIKKGQRGADCLQIVNTNDMANCGKIYYESKRAKDFQKSWIEKFKSDMRDKGVDVGVLVTTILPKELDRMGFYDGVWVCTFDEFKGSVALIRNGIIQISLAKKSQEGKSDKMNLLYSFLTSNEFNMQVEAIVEGFTTMRNDLHREKASMAKLWKQREKQLDKVLENTAGMYGSIKGIAGNAIGNVQALELEHIATDEEEK